MPNFPVCINLLTLQVLSLNPSVFSYCHLLHKHRHTLSFLVWCVWTSAFLRSIVSVSSSLCKCQSKLLLFPDHAVGDGPTSSPWQPSVLPQRKGKGREERNFYASKPPPSSLIPVHCSPALNHVARLPGFPATAEEEKRSAAITEEAMREFLLNVTEILAETLWGTALWYKFHKWIALKNRKHKVQFLKN